MVETLYPCVFSLKTLTSVAYSRIGWGEFETHFGHVGDARCLLWPVFVATMTWWNTALQILVKQKHQIPVVLSYPTWNGVNVPVKWQNHPQMWIFIIPLHFEGAGSGDHLTLDWESQEMGVVILAWCFSLYQHPPLKDLPGFRLSFFPLDGLNHVSGRWQIQPMEQACLVFLDRSRDLANETTLWKNSTGLISACVRACVYVCVPLRAHARLVFSGRGHLSN